jgi:hypothetical protein
MATGWNLTFDGDPTAADFAEVAEMVAQRFTNGHLDEPGAHPFATPPHNPAQCTGCTLRIAGILADLNDYEAAHMTPAGEAAYNIWDDLIVRLPEYEADTTEAARGGDYTRFVALGTVFSYSDEAGRWVTMGHHRALAQRMLSDEADGQ